MQRLQEAVALYGGDFLAGLTVQESDGFEEWRRIKQEQLHLEMMVALRQLTVIHEAQGDWVRALAYARRQLALEPWREEAHRQVIRLLALLGERSLALAHYHTCRQALKAELGIEPDAETTALYEAIRADKLDKVTRWQGDKMKETAHPVTLSSPDTVGH